MPTEIDNIITIRTKTDDGKNKIEEIVSRIKNKKLEHRNSWLFGDFLVTEKEDSPTREDITDANWSIENIGSRWCLIEDYDSSRGTLRLVCISASTPPIEGLQKVLAEIEETDPNVIATLTCEDGEPSFWGAYVFLGQKIIDDREDYKEDIFHVFSKEHPEIMEHFNTETQQWEMDESGELTEEAFEARDEFESEIWEWIMSKQNDFITYAKKLHNLNDENEEQAEEVL